MPALLGQRSSGAMGAAGTSVRAPRPAPGLAHVPPGGTGGALGSGSVSVPGGHREVRLLRLVLLQNLLGGLGV